MSDEPASLGLNFVLCLQNSGSSHSPQTTSYMPPFCTFRFAQSKEQFACGELPGTGLSQFLEHRGCRAACGRRSLHDFRGIVDPRDSPYGLQTTYYALPFLLSSTHHCLPTPHRVPSPQSFAEEFGLLGGWSSRHGAAKNVAIQYLNPRSRAASASEVDLAAVKSLPFVTASIESQGSLLIVRVLQRLRPLGQY